MTGPLKADSGAVIVRDEKSLINHFGRFAAFGTVHGHAQAEIKIEVSRKRTPAESPAR